MMRCHNLHPLVFVLAATVLGTGCRSDESSSGTSVGNPGQLTPVVAPGNEVQVDNSRARIDRLVLRDCQGVATEVPVDDDYDFDGTDSLDIPTGDYCSVQLFVDEPLEIEGSVVADHDREGEQEDWDEDEEEEIDCGSLEEYIGELIDDCDDDDERACEELEEALRVYEEECEDEDEDEDEEEQEEDTFDFTLFIPIADQITLTSEQKFTVGTTRLVLEIGEPGWLNRGSVPVTEPDQIIAADEQSAQELAAEAKSRSGLFSDDNDNGEIDDEERDNARIASPPEDTPAPSGNNDGEVKSGCSHAAHAPGSLWTLGILGIVLTRRRRRPSPLRRAPPH